MAREDEQVFDFERLVSEIGLIQEIASGKYLVTILLCECGTQKRGQFREISMLGVERMQKMEKPRGEAGV